MEEGGEAVDGGRGQEYPEGNALIFVILLRIFPYGILPDRNPPVTGLRQYVFLERRVVPSAPH